ncbi:MAG: ABC transporter substrate-binding protein [Planctomycetota bacterium]|nr:MAG: ABC transporter substrate-binding protein [Planctomycetota bacterium]
MKRDVYIILIAVLGIFILSVIAFLMVDFGPEMGNQNILIFGRGGDSVTLDPSHATDGETFYATTQVYDTLVQFKYGTTELEPGLAEKWEISPDGLEYTFHLRKGILFHKTSYFPKKVEFTADDVIFSLGRQLKWVWQGELPLDFEKNLLKSFQQKKLDSSLLDIFRKANLADKEFKEGKKNKNSWILTTEKRKILFEKENKKISWYIENPEPYHKVGGSFKYWLNMNMDSIVKRILKKGKYQVSIVLKRPEAPFLSNLAMNFASILCYKYSRYLLEKKEAEKISRYPIGTGPFIFRKWIKDDRIIFDRNPSYFGGAPKIKRLILKVIPQNSARAAALKAKQIHIMDFPNPQEIKDLKKLPYIKIIQQEGLNVGYLAMNTRKKPFDNVKVRRAIYQAINRKAIVKAVYEGFGKVAVNPLPPTIWAYNPNIKDYEYNPEKAKELLAQAGYPNGFETDLWAMPVPRPYMPSGRKIAEAIQADLAKIGVKVKIVSYDWGIYLEKVEKGEHSMALLGWTGDNGDPDNFLYVLLSSQSTKVPASNIAFYSNPEFDRLLEKAKRITLRDRRRELYWKAQEIFHRDVPWVPIAHSIVVEPMLKNVQGFKLDPVGSRRFYKVYFR